MHAISHITLGTNDPVRANAFYDAVLAVLGFKRRDEPDDPAAAYFPPQRWPVIYIYRPFDGGPATYGNGTHIALNAETREQVRQFHALALQHGGSDEGQPGLRPHYGEHYYAAYVRDPDGNKLQAVCYAAELAKNPT